MIPIFLAFNTDLITNIPPLTRPGTEPLPPETSLEGATGAFRLFGVCVVDRFQGFSVPLRRADPDPVGTGAGIQGKRKYVVPGAGRARLGRGVPADEVRAHKTGRMTTADRRGPERQGLENRPEKENAYKNILFHSLNLFSRIFSSDSK